MTIKQIRYLILANFEYHIKKDGISFAPTDRRTSYRQFRFCKQRNQCDDMSQTQIGQKKFFYYTIKLSLASLFPVSFKSETINGRMPKLFVTTSSGTGIEPGSSVLVTEIYFLVTSDQATVTFSLHR